MRPRFAMRLCAALIGLTSGSVTLATHAAEDRRASRTGAEYYMQLHGVVPVAQLPRVYAVFDEVRRVADKSSTAWPELIVVKDDQQAAAFVLDDGSVILSRRALNIMRDGVDAVTADARLAFVIGHELAHLADNDFWDGQIAQLASGAGVPSSVRNELTNDDNLRRKELKADDLGFLYAALAGHRVDRLVPAAESGQPFLAYWMDRIGAESDAHYPSAQTRTEALRMRLEDRLRSVEAFHFGVRLLHFGRHTEGLALLREYQRQFPSREVFSNLGYGHLQRAISRMPSEFAYHYWLPGMTDLRTSLSRLALRATSIGPRSGWRIPAAAREDLHEAIRYFELAITKDGRYFPAQLNLATAHLLLGMEPRSLRANSEHLLRAESALAAAQALGTSDPQARLLSTIVRTEREQLEAANVSRAPSIDSDDPTVNYNLARLASDDPNAAGSYWSKALAQFEVLPSPVQSLLCLQASSGLHDSRKELEERCAQSSVKAPPTVPPWTLPVALSRDLLEAPFNESERARFGVRETQLARSKVFAGTAFEVLAIDDITTLVVLKDPARVSEDLLRCCAQPLRRTPTTSGELWHYGSWIAWIRDAKVHEVWVAN